jgi:hypothetical protein
LRGLYHLLLRAAMRILRGPCCVVGEDPCIDRVRKAFGRGCGGHVRLGQFRAGRFFTIWSV